MRPAGHLQLVALAKVLQIPCLRGCPAMAPEIGPSTSRSSTTASRRTRSCPRESNFASSSTFYEMGYGDEWDPQLRRWPTLAEAFDPRAPLGRAGFRSRIVARRLVVLSTNLPTRRKGPAFHARLTWPSRNPHPRDVWAHSPCRRPSCRPLVVVRLVAVVLGVAPLDLDLRGGAASFAVSRCTAPTVDAKSGSRAGRGQAEAAEQRREHGPVLSSSLTSADSRKFFFV